MMVSESSTIVILLAACVGLLAMGLMLIFRLLARLSSIESLLAINNSSSEASAVQQDSSEKMQGGAFEAFLKEDPSRRKLPKREQFAGYRRWRQENGLNWSNP